MATIEEKLASPRIKVYFTEVLDACASKKTRAERIELLRKFRDKTTETKLVVQKTMECLTHPKVVMELPEGLPPLKDTGVTDYNTAPLTLLKAFDKIPYYVKICPPFIKNTIKRESIFLQMLESMYKRDAEFFACIKDKKITGFHGVNNQLLIDAYMPESKLGNESPVGGQE
jgi:hypothetical protein